MPKTAAAVPNTHEQIWLDHLQRCRREGQSLAEYARAHDLTITRFYAWKARLEARGLWTEKEPPVSFLPVSVLDSPAAGVRLKLPNGVTFEFNQPLDFPLLTRLFDLAVALP